MTHQTSSKGAAEHSDVKWRLLRTAPTDGATLDPPFTSRNAVWDLLSPRQGARPKLPATQIEVPNNYLEEPRDYRSSVAEIAAGWTVRGSTAGGGEIVRSRPDLPWGQPSLMYKGYQVFPGVKRPGRGFEHSLPSSAEVKERVQLYLSSPSGPLWPVLGWTSPFLRNWGYSGLLGCYCVSRGGKLRKFRRNVGKSTNWRQTVTPHMKTDSPWYQDAHVAERVTLMFYESRRLQLSSVQFAVLNTARKLLPNVHVNAQWLEAMTYISSSHSALIQQNLLFVRSICSP
jgi:hypothetical protein